MTREEHAYVLIQKNSKNQGPYNLLELTNIFLTRVLSNYLFFYMSLKTVCTISLNFFSTTMIFCDGQLQSSSCTYGSSSPDVFCKKGVIRYFVKFTRKQLCQSLYFNTIAGFRLWHRYFPVNLAKFLRIPFLTEHLRWLLLHFKGCLFTCLGCHFCFTSYKSNFVTF